MIRTIQSPQGSKVCFDGKTVINLASNNYLGLANHPALVEAAKSALDLYGVGPGAGRTIAGNFPVHNELEQALASFKEVEATLVFNSGLTANAGLLPLLVEKGDAIFSDSLNHASIIDGCRLTRAQTLVYAHQDLNALEDALKSSNANKKLIVTDGVFSMDGDLAPLDGIAALAQRYHAEILVDDAHGDGVMGPFGKGTVHHFGLQNQIKMETGSLSKAFGAAGGFIAGSRELIECARQNARSFLFTASPLPPAIASAALAAVQLVSRDDSRLIKLWQNRDYFASGMQAQGFDTGKSSTPIVPIYIGDEETSQQMSHLLYEDGVFAQSIQYPMVAKGHARLRCILCALHTQEELDFAIAAFTKASKALALCRP